MHRYIYDLDKLNGFKGELIIISDGDWDEIDEKTFNRLEKAKDYVIIFFEDDISIETKKNIEESFKENDLEDLKKHGINNFQEWLMGRSILAIIIKDCEVKDV